MVHFEGVPKVTLKTVEQSALSNRQENIQQPEQQNVEKPTLDARKEQERMEQAQITSRKILEVREALMQLPDTVPMNPSALARRQAVASEAAPLNRVDYPHLPSRYTQAT